VLGLGQKHGVAQVGVEDEGPRELPGTKAKPRQGSAGLGVRWSIVAAAELRALRGGAAAQGWLGLRWRRWRGGWGTGEARDPIYRAAKA